MKITIQKAEEQKPESKYPYFGISEIGNLVLFTKPSTGILIKGGSSNTEKTGTCSSDYTESRFTPFNGTIKIEQ